VHVIAGASPDNTPAGYYWTFLFPEILFIVIALILWALFGRPHHRVPAQRILLGMTSKVGVAGVAAAAVGPAVAANGGTETVTAPAEPSAGTGDSAVAEPSSDGAGAGE
jgi:hypothetical protein